MILATCNRVEVCGVAEVPGEARSAVFARLGGQHGFGLETIEPLLYTKTEDEAVLHVFRVAASLDSMILGEPQILGQVKDAFALAQSAGTVGPVLHALMSQAFGVAKKVRTETEVGRLAVSVSFAAVELARKIFGSLEGKAVLLVGAGEMSELAARHLIDQGAHPVYVANRTWSRAQDLARTFAGIAVRFEDFAATMGLVDIVITSTAAPEPLVRAAAVRQALHDRRERPLFFIDIGVPRNVEAGVNDLGNAFCYDIDDLRSVVEANLKRAPAGGAPGARHRGARGRALRRATRGARGRADDRVAPREAGGDPARRARPRARPAARGRRGDAAGDGSAVAGDRQQGAAHAHRQAAGLVARRPRRALRRARLGDLRPLGTGPAA